MNIDSMRKIDRIIGSLICNLLIPLNNQKKKDFNEIKVRKILLIKFFGIGSIVYCSPAIAALKKKFKNAKIIFLTMSSNKGLYDKNDFLDEIIYLDLKNFSQIARDSLNLVSRLKRENIDLLINFEPLSRYTMMIGLLGRIKYKIGFVLERPSKNIYNAPVDYNEGTHIVEKFSNLLKPINLTTSLIPKKPIISKKAKENLNNFLKKERIKDEFLCVNINTSDLILERRYPPEKFAKILDSFLDRYNYDIIFIGSKSERNYVQSCIDLMKNKVHNFAGKTTLPELIHLLSRSKFLLSNDSGPVHIASVLGTPTISIFGPETPELYGPLGKKDLILYKALKCSPCVKVNNAKKVNCQNNALCIRSISKKEIFKKMQEAMNYK